MPIQFHPGNITCSGHSWKGDVMLHPKAASLYYGVFQALNGAWFAGLFVRDAHMHDFRRGKRLDSAEDAFEWALEDACKS